MYFHTHFSRLCWWNKFPTWLMHQNNFSFCAIKRNHMLLCCWVSWCAPAVFLSWVLIVSCFLVDINFLQSLNKGQKQFVHFVLDPVPSSGSSTGASYAARYGCLVYIENVSLNVIITLWRNSILNHLHVFVLDPNDVYLPCIHVPVI